MRQKRAAGTGGGEKTIRDIRRATRRQYPAEEKIRIVLDGLRGEDSIAELCRREGINQNPYYRWSKEFLEAGKKHLAGDTAHTSAARIAKDAKQRDGVRLYLADKFHALEVDQFRSLPLTGSPSNYYAIL
jgi:transposase